MDVVIADADGRPIRQTGDYALDLAYGSDENRYTLSVSGAPMGGGWRWWCDGTPYGGVVDTVCIDHEPGGSTAMSYKGRDVHGIMEKAVVRPDAGESHLEVSGEANALIRSLLERCGVGWLAPSEEDSGIRVDRHRFRRYVDLWSGLRMMLASAGARPSVSFVDGIPVISAVRSERYGELPSELVGFSAEREHRRVNHLIGLGPGEGADRAVCDWYADSRGALSQEQSLFGIDEVCETCNLSSESEDLSGATREKLAEYQGQGTFEVTLSEGSLDVGDAVVASDAESGIDVSSEIVKVIVKAKNGTPSVSYEAGTPQWPEEEA